MKQNYSGGTPKALISNKKALDINQVLMEKFLMMVVLAILRILGELLIYRHYRFDACFLTRLNVSGEIPM